MPQNGMSQTLDHTNIYQSQDSQPTLQSGLSTSTISTTSPSSPSSNVTSLDSNLSNRSDNSSHWSRFKLSGVANVDVFAEQQRTNQLKLEMANKADVTDIRRKTAQRFRKSILMKRQQDLTDHPVNNQLQNKTKRSHTVVSAPPSMNQPHNRVTRCTTIDNPSGLTSLSDVRCVRFGSDFSTSLTVAPSLTVDRSKSEAVAPSSTVDRSKSEAVAPSSTVDRSKSEDLRYQNTQSESSLKPVNDLSEKLNDPSSDKQIAFDSSPISTSPQLLGSGPTSTLSRSPGSGLFPLLQTIESGSPRFGSVESNQVKSLSDTQMESFQVNDNTTDPRSSSSNTVENTSRDQEGEKN
eukprot:CAMPEP_0185775028 /NCGR_PEP_ID=MMETSP1174-20130828/80959_1 /TAXON_ID=35687 /ORGANISM="Dictyocha speculum, Strain CCMP1381" /LENGTH=349 /DNA_ID=CAMNT_0028462477 /DNA_START=30 /DNA_END=1079 /DNA_ORIENTATION=+